jgi:integrase
MICTVKEINRLVDKIRDGKPPFNRRSGKRRADEKFEEVFLDPTLPGFGIRCLHTGGASWFVHYKLHGRQKKVTIGDVRVLDRLDREERNDEGKLVVVKGALRAARDLLAKVQLDRLDPQAAKEEARRTAKITFKSVVEQFLASVHVGRGTHRTYKNILQGYYFEPLHNMPLDEITSEQINLQVQRITHRSGSQAAWKAVSPMKGLFKWATRHDLFAGTSPMLKVDQPEKNPARTRVLEDDEIRTIWKACLDWEAEVLADDERIAKGLRPTHAGKRSSANFGRCVRLLFYTGCRAQEIGDLQWKEIKWKEGELHIPAARIKTRTPLFLPLTDSALTILKSIPHNRPDYVFGKITNKGRSGTGSAAGIDLTSVGRKIDDRIAETFNKPSLDAAKEQEVRRLLAQGVKTWRIRRVAHVHWRRVKQIEAKIAAEKARTAIAAPALPEWFKPVPDWTPHDIRRTVVTGMSKIGINSDIAERIVNHKGHIDPMKAVYDHHDYRVQKRQALERWETHLNAILGIGEEKIVSLDAARNGRTA